LGFSLPEVDPVLNRQLANRISRLLKRCNPELHLMGKYHRYAASVAESLNNRQQKTVKREDANTDFGGAPGRA